MEKTRVWLLALLLMGAWMCAGCEQELFENRGHSTSVIDKYYGGDSAQATAASRLHGSDMGFGMPTGGGQQ